VDRKWTTLRVLGGGGAFLMGEVPLYAASNSFKNVGTFTPKKFASSILLGGVSDLWANLFFYLRNAGKSVGCTFLNLRMFMKNGRWHILKFKKIYKKRSVEHS